MAWIIFVVSLAFIAGIQARYPECNGNEPWPLKESTQTVSFIEDTINSHLKRIDEWRNKTYKRLLALNMNVAYLYIESIFATKWENIKDVSYKQAAVCYNVTSRDSQRTLQEFTSKKQVELNVLYEQYPKAQHINLEWHEKNKGRYGHEDFKAKEAAIKAYADICKVSGHVTPALDTILKAIDSMEQMFISRARECYYLIFNEQIDDESADNVKKWLRQTFSY